MNIIDEKIYENLNLLPYDCQGWHGNHPIFEELINKAKPKLIIEVGTWKGQSAINMAKIIKKIKLDCKIYCVDTWLGALEFWGAYKHTPERNLNLKNGYPQIYYQFLSNVVHENLQDLIIPFPNTSSIAYSHFKNNNIKADLIYIDGSHEEEDVYIDLKNYTKLLNKDGIIFGDDWPGGAANGVKAAVNKFIKENNLNLKITNDNIFWQIF